MSNTNPTSSFTDVKKNLHVSSESHKLSWNQLVKEAKGQIGEMKLRIGKLKAAIKYFENQQEAGESCPFAVKEPPTQN